MFGKKKEKTTKKIDKIVTGIIIGSAIASIFGLSQTRKGKEITSNIGAKSAGLGKKTYYLFGKMMGKAISKCSKKHK